MSAKRLHIGCGRNILTDWINLDCVALPGVNVVADLNTCGTTPLPFDDDTIVEFLGSHLLEHIPNILPLMQELHRIAIPNAKAVFRVPYGSSDDAFEDPTHVRQFFLHSFGYFSQPFYWRADYGYRGDWETDHIQLKVSRERYAQTTAQEILNDIRRYRNVVLEMVATLRAIKPIRPPRRELQTTPHVELALV